MAVIEKKNLLNSQESKKKILHVLEKLYIARFIDRKMSLLVKQNKGTAFFLSTAGHEMIGTLTGMAFDETKDWALPYYRDRCFALAANVSAEDIIAGFLARKSPHHSQGRMMLDHFSDPSKHFACQSSCVGSQFLQAVGIAQSLKWQKTDGIVYVSAGDGATSQGDYHEALNYACIHKLPVIFVIQDNGWAISVPTHEQIAGKSIAKRANGYPNMHVIECNGADYTSTQQAIDDAFSYTRQGNGPSLIIAKVPRLGSHSNSDDHKKYKTEEMFKEDEAKDPVKLMEIYVLENKILTEEELKLLQLKAKDLIEKAAEKAEQVPFPAKETATDHVFVAFAPPESKKCPLKEKGAMITMMDGLNHALIEEMEKDPTIVVFGQDVAHGKGGVFGITRTLTERFGKDRCFNSPLAESTIIGMAVGMAQEGHYKPIVEIQFVDYVWTGMNQLCNELASIIYRSAGEFNCPVVVRMPYGGYIQGGPYHSQSIEAVLCHIPGLKVVVPSNAADAKRLLKTAILDPNPVIFLEHKALYRQYAFSAKEEPGPDEYLEFGKAKVVKEGLDLTLIGWGMMIPMAYEIAAKLEKENISVEIIDLRTLNPLDTETILESVKKTSKVLIAHEAPLNAGFGAEIAATIADQAFNYLDAPIKRLGGKNCPVPFCKDLENAVLPQKEDLEQAIRELAEY